MKMNATLEETRRERERDAIIHLVANGLDPMLEILSHHNTNSKKLSDDEDTQWYFPEYRWDEIVKDDQEDYPSMGSFLLSEQLPMDDSIQSDIKRDHPHLVDECMVYRQYYRTYSESREQLHADIDSFLKNEFLEENRDWLKDLGEDWEMNVIEYMSKNSNMYANFLLRCSFNKEPMETDPDRFREIWERDRFKSDFELLIKSQQNLLKKRSELESKLEAARDTYMNQYQIREYHVKESGYD